MRNPAKRSWRGPQGVKVLQLIGSIKEIYYPALICALPPLPTHASASTAFSQPDTSKLHTSFTKPWLSFTSVKQRLFSITESYSAL